MRERRNAMPRQRREYAAGRRRCVPRVIAAAAA
jgi:hypothetical protein